MKSLLFLFLVPATVLGQCLTADDSAQTPDPSVRRLLYDGQQKFAIDMLNVANDVTPTENVFFSPISIYNALMLAYFTAANQTEEGLKKALFIPENQSKVSIMQAYAAEKLYQKMVRSKDNASKYELLNANRLFVSNKLKVRDCIQTLFSGEIAPMDFVADPKGSLATINNWVANQTKNQIKDVLSEGQITQATDLVLANAAYFKGWWKNKFQPEATRKEVFYISNSQNAFVTMMKQKSNFNHLVSEKLGAHVLELPYKGDEVSLIILLPPFASPNGVTNILRRMKTQNFHKMVTEEMIERPVDVSIPKFSIEQELKLVPILDTLKIGDLFTASADLSGLTGEPGLKLDDAVHKAKITLDEEGTTASAATLVFNFRSSRPLDPVRFICNHPFVYTIYDKLSHTILFTGIYNKPPPS